MAQKPTNAPPTATMVPAPRRSIHHPTTGDTATAQMPPRLTALEKSPRDRPRSVVMGTRKMDRVATAMTGLEE